MKLFVWNSDAYGDFTYGIVFAVAETKEEAKRLILARVPTAGLEIDLEAEPIQADDLPAVGFHRGGA